MASLDSTLFSSLDVRLQINLQIDFEHAYHNSAAKSLFLGCVMIPHGYTWPKRVLRYGNGPINWFNEQSWMVVSSTHVNFKLAPPLKRHRSRRSRRRVWRRRKRRSQVQTAARMAIVSSSSHYLAHRMKKNSQNSSGHIWLLERIVRLYHQRLLPARQADIERFSALIAFILHQLSINDSCASNHSMWYFWQIVTIALILHYEGPASCSLRRADQY